MYRSIVLRCAAAYLFCARPILDASRPISAPSGMMVLYGGAATIAKNELDPDGLHLIDFFSRRPERGRPSDTRPQRGGKGDQVGGQVSPGRAGATENLIQQGTSSPRQHDQCAARQQAPLDSARDLRQDDALDEARALEAKGLDEEALLIVSSLIVDNDEFVEAYLERAKIYLNRNMFDLAARDYREAISCSANSVEAHYGLGITCEKWAERLEASGDSPRAYEKFREAILEYKKTLWYSRGYAPAYYGLGCAYSRLGMREDALYYFKRAMESAKRGSDLARRARHNVQLLGGY
jgi:hypothetical protein